MNSILDTPHKNNNLRKIYHKSNVVNVAYQWRIPIVLFTLKLNDYVEYTCSRELGDKTDNYMVSDKQPTGKILTLIRLQIL